MWCTSSTHMPQRIFRKDKPSQSWWNMVIVLCVPSISSKVLKGPVQTLAFLLFKILEGMIC